MSLQINNVNIINIDKLELPLLFKNKCDYYNAKENFNNNASKLSTQSNLHTNDFDSNKYSSFSKIIENKHVLDDDVLDYLLYTKYNFKISQILHINSTILNELCFNEPITISNLSPEQKIALYYFIQNNYSELYKCPLMYYKNIIEIDILYDYDIFNIDYITFGRLCKNDKYYIYITNELLKNKNFTKRFSQILLFELSFNLFKLDHYPHMLSEYHSNMVYDVAIFDRYVYIKIIVQILFNYKFYNYNILIDFDIDKLCIKILNEKEIFWPDKDEAILLYKSVVKQFLTDNLNITENMFPEFNTKYYFSNKWYDEHIFKIYPSHYKPIVYNKYILKKLYEEAGIELDTDDYCLNKYGNYLCMTFVSSFNKKMDLINEIKFNEIKFIKK